MAEYLALIDFLAIVEANTDLRAEELADNDETISRALVALWAPAARQAGREVYRSIQAKAAILEFSMIRQRPLPQENILVAHECMKEFAWRNGFWFDWRRDNADVHALFQRIITGELDGLFRLTLWLQQCLVPR
jgi:prophage maintenance system killer protein